MITSHWFVLTVFTDNLLAVKSESAKKRLKNIKKWTARKSLRPTGSDLFIKEKRSPTLLLIASDGPRWYRPPRTSDPSIISCETIFVISLYIHLSIRQFVGQLRYRTFHFSPALPTLYLNSRRERPRYMHSGCNYTARLTLRYHHRAFSKVHAFSYHVISRRKSRRQRRIIYTLSIRLVNKSNYLRVYFDQSIAHRRADEIKIIDSFYPKYLLQNLLKHLIIEIFFQ